jgi:hypothetical protein
MCIESMLKEFDCKLVTPLLADLTRTLEVTCYKKGPDNHGSNFIGNAVVLSGIETLAQFNDQNTIEDHCDFEKQATKLYKCFPDNKIKFLSKKYAPTAGSDLAQNFIKAYFCRQVFQKKEFGVPIYKLVWDFRNPHMHAFYPFSQKKYNTKMISGAVDWLYKDCQKHIGITIEEIEYDFDVHRRKLYKVEKEKEKTCLRLCPQILFVYFKRGIKKFKACVRNDPDVQRRFCENYKRLAPSYHFQL